MIALTHTLVDGIWRGLVYLGTRFWGVAALFLAWQLWVVLQDYNSIVLPTPLGVGSKILEDTAFFAIHTGATLYAATVGLILGVFLGTLFATLCWFTPLMDGLLTPGIMLLRSVPIVAIIPIVARLLGYDTTTVLAISVMLAFFPTFVFFLSGLRDYSVAARDLFSALGVRSKWRTLRLLAFPAAIPNLATSLRLAAPGCVLGALIAEFLMGTEGLGYVMMRARSEMMMERAWGAALIAMVISVVLFAAANYLERRVREAWQA